MKKIILLACLSSVYGFLKAQDDYRSTANPYYWKNRKPVEGYWQQDVAYKIKAKLDDKTDIIEGSEELTYWNNSPDELGFVYFRLTQNAFQPGSYLDNQQKENKILPKYGRYEYIKLGTDVESVVSGGKTLKTELDNTILKVYLEEPLKSGQSISFNVKFKTYFDKGSTRRRMKLFNVDQYKHYDGVHWYPRLSVYDRKFGWTTDQHLGKEFYGDFGTYDVELSLPNNYVVEATGLLQNTQEVMPDSLRKKLDVKNFANKPLNQAASQIIKPDGTFKTYKYHAINVHDFAFTADPTYRIGEAEYKGVKCIAVVQEPHAAGWQNAASYTAKIIQTYSEDIGMYAYPKMVVADARDGMEYPMLTLDGGLDPDYHQLLAHEVGHNWFFGMVGNNETYRAALDEGFTQFLTSWCVEKLDGPVEPIKKDSSIWKSYSERYARPVLIRDKRVYNAYIADAVRDIDMPLNTHSDQFNGALEHGGGYRHVYYKTATMLYNLQYTLGDELFLKAMQHYFDQWKICHPYFEDFRNSIIQYTHVDLNWFFDQWLESTKHIDYSVASIKKDEKDDEYTITFKRKGSMQMPLDFQITANDDRKYDFHIPNDWFVKKTTATVLPRWIGWNNVQPVYKAHVKIPMGIDNVVIDTTRRLADINMLNNSHKFPSTLTFDSEIAGPPDRNRYELRARPDLWYNSYDGIKLGVHTEGGYLDYKHVFSLTIWFNTGMRQSHIPLHTGIVNKYENLSYNFTYQTGVEKFSRNTYLNVAAKSLEGLQSYSFGGKKTDDENRNTFYTYFKSMYRRDTTYLLYRSLWPKGRFNNTVNVGFEHLYKYFKGDGAINIAMKSTTLGSDYAYAAFSLTSINHNKLGKFDLNTRVFGQLGTGSSFAPESQLYLSGANPEEMMDNKFTRSRGFVDNSWLGYGASTNHFQMGGGLNLRGYAGYLAAQLDENDAVRYTYKGTSGASTSLELNFDRLFKFHPRAFRKWLKMETYVFADGGVINYNVFGESFALSDFRADAGLGTALTIKKWGPLTMAKPLTIRFDVPVWLSNAPAADKGNFKLRWVLGLNKSF